LKPIPSTIVTLDFETFFDPERGYTLKKLTHEAYIRDPRFEVIGVGVKVNAGPSVWLEDADFRVWMHEVDWANAAVLGHNMALFDAFILAHHYGIKAGFYLDTLPMSRALNGPTGNNLKDLSIKYGVGEKGDELINAKGKRRRHFTPEEWLRFGDYCRQDCDLTHGIFQKMPFPEVELRLINLTARCFVDPTLELDRPLAEAYLVQEKDAKRKLLLKVVEVFTGRKFQAATEEDALALAKPVLLSNDKFAAQLLELGIEPGMKVSAQASKKAGHDVYAYAFAKTDSFMQELLETDEPPEARYLAEARIGVKSTINETRAERFLAIASRGRLPVPLKYYGAHTGRWSGTDKVNFQNLPRVFYDKATGEMLTGHLRQALRAPKGEALVVVDLAQIEPRVTAWLAGHDDMLDSFRRNDAQTRVYRETGQGEEGDIYSDEGSKFFGKKLSKSKTKKERQAAKSMIIGLGYGMGWLKFAGVLLKDGVQFDASFAEQYGVDVRAFAAAGPKGKKTFGEQVEEMPSRLPLEERITHCAVTKYFVDLYRRVNTPVTELWAHMEEVLESMLVEDAEPWPVGPGGVLKVVRHALVLPNGLQLRYPGLRMHQKTRADGRPGKPEFTYLGGKSGKQVEKAYGGHMVENVVQALARIVLGEMALDIEDRAIELGGRFVTTTHDETVAAVPERHADELFKYALERMRVAPSWAPGLPLDADGGIAAAYGEAK
jgi:DNA polymerase